MSYILEADDFRGNMDAGTLRNKIGRRGHYTVCAPHDPEHQQKATEWFDTGETWTGTSWVPIRAHE